MSTAKPSAHSKAQALQSEDEDEDPDMPGLMDDEDSDDEESPVRGRTRRPSEKQQELMNEMEAAKARKAAKAQKAEKAARKRDLVAAGQDPDEDMGPRPDDLFSARTVESRPTAVKKTLTQRNSKVPQPLKFPSSDWRPTPAHASWSHHVRNRDEHDDGRYTRDSHHRSSDDHNDRHRYTRSQSPVRFRGRSPAPAARPPSPPPLRNINGGVVPEHIELNLRHRARSLSSGRGYSPVGPHGGRSPSPIAGDKRARSPRDNDVRPSQAQRTGTSTRPKAKDFDDITQELIALAIRIYRVLLSTRQGFPEHASEPSELELLRMAWSMACEQSNLVMDLTPTISKLITGRGSHLRGEFKTKIRPIVELIYGFKSGQNKKNLGSNRQLVEDLKNNLTFTFKDIGNRKGIYRHPIIQKAVNAMWFANRRDEGPNYPEYFNPFPKQALALVLTVVENAIDEWATGIRTDIPFTANEYRSIYEGHIEALQQFEHKTHPHKILDNILVRLHNVGRFHSGAQPITDIKPSVLSKNDVDAAIEEYVNDEETESDGENGDDDN